MVVDSGADDLRRGVFRVRLVLPPIFHGLRTLLDNVICRARRNSGQPTNSYAGVGGKVDGVGVIDLKGDACVAPTRIGGQRYAGVGGKVDGVSWGRWSARLICGIRVMAVRRMRGRPTADLRMNVLLFDPVLGFWEQLVSPDYCGWPRCRPARERNGRRRGIPGAVRSIDLL